MNWLKKNFLFYFFKIKKQKQKTSPVDRYEKKGRLQVNHALNQANIFGDGH